MKNLILLLLLLPVLPTAHAQSNGVYNATTYAYTTQITAGNTAIGSSSIVANPTAFAQGIPFSPYNTNASITLNRNAGDAETITPSAVTNCFPNGQSCSLSGTFSFKHMTGESIQSGTFGLQEAINVAMASGSGTIVIDASWQGPAGSSLITAAKGNNNVMIQDNRNPSGAVFYQWNGSAYVAQGGGGVSATDTRPRATTSVVSVTVAANGNCLLSVSPATAGQLSENACATAGAGVGPGTITHIHLTLGPAGDKANVIQNSTVTFTCDGNAQTVPLNLFFLTQDNPTPFSTDWNSDALGNLGGNFSGNRRMEYNFTTGCNVTFHNASATNSTFLFAEIDYRLGASVSRSSRAYWHSYVQPLISVAQYANFQMLPTIRDNSGGELESTTLFVSSGTNAASLEGYTTVTVDGNAAVVANGTEDFFGSGFYGVNSVGGHFSPKWGEFYSSAIAGVLGGSVFSLQTPINTYDALLYRNFQTDDRENALYTSTLGVFSPNGEATKAGAIPPGATNMASMVTFWTHDPMVATPTFSPAAGPVTVGTTVTISDATASPTLCYTVDGSAPTANGAGTCTHGTNGSSVVINTPTTVNAIGSKSTFADSFIASAGYTLPNTLTFNTYAFNVTSGSASVFTTTAITLTLGDFVFLMCQQGVPITNTWSASDSNANTWTTLTNLQGGNAGSSGAFFISSAKAGSTTFTCTSSASGTFSEAIAMVYHSSLGTTTLMAGTNVSASTQCSSGTACTTNAFTTAGASLIMMCGIINNNGNWVAGPIGTNTATLRGAGGASFSGVNPACEDTQFATSQSGITSSITSGVSAFWNVVGAAFH